MKESKFDGGLLQFIGWSLLGGLIIGLTFGIATPWALCMIYSWKNKHTIINGRRLTFDGTGGQLFGNWIKWLLLTIITLGIYGLWVNLKLVKWITMHTHFEDEMANITKENNESKFDGALLPMIGWSLLASLIIILTFGIAAPWAICMLNNWEENHTVIDGKRLSFDGTGSQLLGNWIIWLLLTFITLGIYGFWLDINVIKWTTKHIHFAETESEAEN